MDCLAVRRVGSNPGCLSLAARHHKPDTGDRHHCGHGAHPSGCCSNVLERSSVWVVATIADGNFDLAGGGYFVPGGGQHSRARRRGSMAPIRRPPLRVDAAASTCQSIAERVRRMSVDRGRPLPMTLWNGRAHQRGGAVDSLRAWSWWCGERAGGVARNVGCALVWRQTRRG